MKHEESKTQCAFIRWCNLHLMKYPALNLAFAIPNGGQRNIITASILKREGARAGVPDWNLPVSATNGQWLSIGLWLEFKHGKNKLTLAQKEYARLLVCYGHEFYICYDVDDAIQVTLDYLKRVPNANVKLRGRA